MVVLLRAIEYEDARFFDKNHKNNFQIKAEIYDFKLKKWMIVNKDGERVQKQNQGYKTDLINDLKVYNKKRE